MYARDMAARFRYTNATATDVAGMFGLIAHISCMSPRERDQYYRTITAWQHGTRTPADDGF